MPPRGSNGRNKSLTVRGSGGTVRSWGGCDFHRLSPPRGGLGAFGAPAWGRARQGRGVGQRQGPAEPWGGHPRGLGVALRVPSCWWILHQLPRAGFLADGRGTF